MKQRHEILQSFFYFWNIKIPASLFSSECEVTYKVLATYSLYIRMVALRIPSLRLASGRKRQKKSPQWRSTSIFCKPGRQNFLECWISCKDRPTSCGNDQILSGTEVFQWLESLFVFSFCDRDVTRVFVYFTRCATREGPWMPRLGTPEKTVEELSCSFNRIFGGLRYDSCYLPCRRSFGTESPWLH